MNVTGHGPACVAWYSHPRHGLVHDQLAEGRKIRVLSVADTFSRFSPVLDPRLGYRGEDVVSTLVAPCAAVGYPRTIRVDQGS